MTKIASSALVLRQRLQRFLYTPHNAGRMQVAAISGQLCELGQVYLFGGALRDIALEGIRYFNSDLDFVVDCQPDALNKLMQQLSATLNVSQNKFGGYRIKCDKWWLDIWPLCQTWAFTHHHVTFDSVNALLNTTITNWDAIIFNLNRQSIISSASYFTELNSGVLDLNLAANPNPQGALLRLLRCLIAKPVKWLTPELQHHLTAQLNKIDFVTLVEYEQQQYSRSYLSQTSGFLINQQLTQAANSNGLYLNCLNKLNLELEYHD
ncbi:hypothetical protein N7931_10685 [Catenovulum sp. 2E275]|uniref:hypothetical protein n=1 Tax=Catenovulum sp. 2E275 TaxID=2980497 RepID=UPI0021CF4854|nr:hypothetical protein [Catenovulum sp. 2E275]MCU4676100.1 hypothetical protein [Catenovulum sp. 2E275]